MCGRSGGYAEASYLERTACSDLLLKKSQRMCTSVALHGEKTLFYHSKIGNYLLDSTTEKGQDGDDESEGDSAPSKSGGAPC
jgi:hypothetical protein